MSTVNGSPAADTAESRPRRLRDLVAVNFGNTLEWFDWTIYTIFAPAFAVVFFQKSDPASALLASLAVFAVGFVTRPLGGLVFGAYADRVGRRKALTVAMMLTAVGSLVIAVAPGYEQVGVLASVILLVARLAQGLAHGGEMGTAVTYLVERAPRDRRALYGSSSWVSVVLGTILATLTGLLLNTVLDKADVAAWGWRLAFGLGGVLGLYALWLRRSLSETEAFGRVHTEAPTGADRPATRGRLLDHWRGVLVVLGLSAGGSIMFYTWLIYMPTFAKVAHGQDERSALTAGLIAQVVFLGAILLAGLAGDRIGRRPLVIAFGAFFTFLTLPLAGMVDGRFSTLLTAMVVSLLGLALLFGVNGAVWAEVFPTHVRAAGVSGPLSFATAIFGGTAPYVNTALAQRGHADWFAVYLSAIAALTLLTGLLMKETRGVDLERDH